jgi:hypothetical protein
MDATVRSVLNINNILDRESDNVVRLAWATDRIVWLAKFRKIPKALQDALCAKATAIMNGSWYGDEPEETVILDYLKKGV